MFSEGIKDLAKPQWISAIRVIKWNGGMPISRLADALGVSYMAAKQYAEDLTKLGYLERIRTPRTAVGRPEIFYRAASKADLLFPSVSMDFSLELLESSRLLFGENAPERLIFQHFESLRSAWSAILLPLPDPMERATKLAELRNLGGAVCSFVREGNACPRLVEIHHPLKALFRKYPTAVAMDTRLITELMEMRVERVEKGNASSAVEYLLQGMPSG